jgi:hypothetical protein
MTVPFGSRYSYYEAPDGRRFCFITHPTFLCPLATFERAEDENRSRVLTDAVVAAAGVLGCDPADLARIIEGSHARAGTSRKRTADGKLTADCGSCGARMERLGFRCFIEAPIPDGEETQGEQASRAIAGRLGFSAPMRTERSFYVDTKREAREWALDELRTAESIAREAATA